MDWLQWLVPAAVGAATSLIVTIVTTRAQLKREREELDAKLKADVDAWKREFAAAAERGPSFTQRLAQQFRDCDNVRFIMIGRQGWGKWFEKLNVTNWKPCYIGVEPAVLLGIQYFSCFSKFQVSSV